MLGSFFSTGVAMKRDLEKKPKNRFLKCTGEQKYIQTKNAVKKDIIKYPPSH